MELSNGIHVIPGIVANTFLIVESDGLTMIDVGLPRNEKKILGYISKLGYRAEDLKRIIITHADDDHYGSLAKLKSLTGAIVYASEIEAKAIQKGSSSRRLKFRGIARFFFILIRVFFHAASVKVDKILYDGQCLPILGNFQVISTPGHTPGHIALFSAAHGILFAGDALRSVEGKLVISTGVNTWDEKKAVESANRLAELNPQIVCTGHGPMIYEAFEKFPKFPSVH